MVEVIDATCPGIPKRMRLIVVETILSDIHNLTPFSGVYRRSFSRSPAYRSRLCLPSLESPVIEATFTIFSIHFAWTAARQSGDNRYSVYNVMILLLSPYAVTIDRDRALTRCVGSHHSSYTITQTHVHHTGHTTIHSHPVPIFLLYETVAMHH